MCDVTVDEQGEVIADPEPKCIGCNNWHVSVSLVNEALSLANVVRAKDVQTN